MARSAQQAGRDPHSVRLIVVTKGHPLETIQQAIDAGLTVFGENYPEEGAAKQQACAGIGPIEWHMIGHVQSRKAALVCQHFTSLHSLDSLKLAVRLDRYASELKRRLPVLLECNVSGEVNKFGFAAWDEAAWPALLPELEQIAALPALRLQGLMTVAPFFDDPEAARPYFRRLSALRAFLTHQLPQADWSQLSMGMSGDFEVAIQEGATLVRIGTAILGPRSYTD